MQFEITDAHYVESYKIDLRFEDGSTGTADLRKYLQAGTAFEKLKDESLFRTFEIEYGTLVWKKYDLDLAPETLYSEATGKEVKSNAEGRLVS
jgi:hypothetical protein